MFQSFKTFKQFKSLKTGLARARIFFDSYGLIAKKARGAGKNYRHFVGLRMTMKAAEVLASCIIVGASV
jgi:hypothetical protein